MINLILLVLLYNLIFGSYKSNALYCGLVGYNGPENSFTLDKLKLLLFWNQERGKDSFGFYTPETGIVKDIGKVEEHLSKKDFTVPNSNLFIGHVRAATIGQVSKINAHPFNFGNIVLAMNGTLKNAWDLCRENKFPIQDFNVDSEVLAAILNKDQNKNVLSKILGGCAIIYTDTTTNKLYCYRNSDRPLYRGMINGGMYISSIENSLKVIGCSDVKEFKQDNLYEIQNGVIKNTYKIKRAVETVVVYTANQIMTTETGVFARANFIHMKAVEFVGKYLTPNLRINESESKFYPLGIRLGYGYEVVAAGSGENEYMLTIINDEGSAIDVSKYTFKEQFPVLSENDYVLARLNIFYSETKNGQFTYANNLLIITGITKDGNFRCKDILTSKEATIPQELIRFAYQKEVEDFRNLFNLDKNNKFIEIENVDESQLPNQLPSKLSDIELFEREITNEDFKTFENLSIYSFENISEIVEEMKEIDLLSSIAKRVDKLDIVLKNFSTKSIESNLI